MLNKKIKVRENQIEGEIESHDATIFIFSVKSLMYVLLWYAKYLLSNSKF